MTDMPAPNHLIPHRDAHPGWRRFVLAALPALIYAGLVLAVFGGFTLDHLPQSPLARGSAWSRIQLAPSRCCSSLSSSIAARRGARRPSAPATRSSARPIRPYPSSVTTTGTWSEALSQPRSRAMHLRPASRPWSAGVTQTWSSRRPRSDAAQSRLR